MINGEREKGHTSSIFPNIISSIDPIGLFRAGDWGAEADCSFFYYSKPQLVYAMYILTGGEGSGAYPSSDSTAAIAYLNKTNQDATP